MYKNLRKTLKKVNIICFVSLLSTTTIADTIKEIKTEIVNLCEKDDKTKCVKLTYEGEQLTIKKADGSSAILNISNANFTKVNTKEIALKNQAGSEGIITHGDEGISSLKFTNFNWLMFGDRIRFHTFGHFDIVPPGLPVKSDQSTFYSMCIKAPGANCLSDTRKRVNVDWIN